MASLSCRISPRTSTVIFFDKSPFATAIVTSAMLRTWAVKFDAIELTLSVKSFHTPVTPPTCAWPPSLPSVPTSRATRVTSEVKTLSCLIMVLTISAERRNSPCSGRPSTSSCTVCNRSPCATAAIARVTSVVGQSRSSISVLTEDFHLPPGALGEAEAHALAGLAFAPHHLTDPFELMGNALIGGDDLVEGVGDLAHDADAVAGHAHGEIADPHGLQRVQQFTQLARLAAIQVRFMRRLERRRIGGTVRAVRGRGGDIRKGLLGRGLLRRRGLHEGLRILLGAARKRPRQQLTDKSGGDRTPSGWENGRKRVLSRKPFRCRVRAPERGLPPHDGTPPEP